MVGSWEKEMRRERRKKNGKAIKRMVLKRGGKYGDKERKVTNTNWFFW